MIKADRKVLIGKNLTNGLGTGGFPKIGAKCAEVSKADIEKVMEGYNLVFVAAGMGGGTGTVPLLWLPRSRRRLAPR